MPTSVYRSTRYIDKHSISAIAVLLHCSQAAAERLALGGRFELTSRVVYEQFDGDRFQAASIC